MSALTHRRAVAPQVLMTALAGVGLCVASCSQQPAVATPTAPTSPSSPTAPTVSTASIESVSLAFRGTPVIGEPIVIRSPETLRISVRFTHNLPRDATLVIHLCVMETSQLIGVGTCAGGSATVALIESIGNVWEQGIFNYRNGAATTTHFVYVGVAEGPPRPIIAPGPPAVGDVVGGRVLATQQLAQTVTFQ